MVTAGYLNYPKLNCPSIRLRRLERKSEFVLHNGEGPIPPQIKLKGPMCIEREESTSVNFALMSSPFVAHHLFDVLPNLGFGDQVWDLDELDGFAVAADSMRV